MADYISREELIEHLNKRMNEPIYDPDMSWICASIVKFIENMKSVDVQTVKRGRWIDCTFYDPYEKSYEQNFEYKCSCCGHMIYNKPNDDNQYCGHCGARMDE